MGRIEVVPAYKVSQLQQSGRLLHDEYVENSIIKPNSNKVYHSDHFVYANQCQRWDAVIDGTIVGTVGAVIDDPVMGLPMDAVYKLELDVLRGYGLVVMEVGNMGGRGLLRRDFEDLLRWPWWWGKRRNVDRIVCGTHPDRAPFYRVSMGFERIGPERLMPGGAPVVLLMSRLKNLPDDPGVWVSRCVNRPTSE